MSRWSCIGWAAALAFVPLLVTARADADGPGEPEGAHPEPSQFKLACARSFEQSQRLRNESHYVAASDEVLKCANLSCGEALFNECTKIFGELQTATPSVVFAARDSAGNELTNVAVAIDGKPNNSVLDGKPVRVDPGNHEFSFSSNGFMATEQVFLIRAGEQFRPLSVVLLRARPRPGPEPQATSQSASENGAPGSAPLASYVLGGVGVLGLGAFVGFRVAGSNSFDALSRDCKPTCSTSSVDSVRQKYLISDLALGVGAAAAVAALTIYFISPREKTSQAALLVSPTADGLVARVAGRF
jgi:hypothetical protein